MTGRRTADEEAVFAPLVTSARRYVQQFRTAPDNQEWVAFDGAAIERWLTQNGQPLWGRDRPSTFVWISVQTGTATGGVLTAEDTSELKQAIDAAAMVRGIPLVWPTTASANTAGASPADLGHRQGAEAVLTGRASNATASATVRWALQFEDRSSEFAGAPQDGVNHAADMYAAMFAASGSLAPVDIEVTGVSDLRDYAALQAYFESLNFITHVGVEALNGDAVKFHLTARGGIESLQHAVTLSGKLQSLPPGETGICRGSSCVDESMHRWLRQLPNLISSIRILLVVPIALALAKHRFVDTLWLFGAAAASDGIDGFLARRFGWQTELGGMLDPVADKLMLATVFVMLAYLGEIPIGLTAAVIARDCIIVAGALSYRLLLGPVAARPSVISKLNTLCQLLFILDVIGTRQYAWPALGPSCLGALVLVTVVVSGIDYVLVYSRLALARAKAGGKVAGAAASSDSARVGRSKAA